MQYFIAVDSLEMTCQGLYVYKDFFSQVDVDCLLLGSKLLSILNFCFVSRSTFSRRTAEEKRILKRSTTLTIYKKLYLKRFSEI